VAAIANLSDAADCQAGVMDLVSQDFSLNFPTKRRL